MEPRNHVMEGSQLRKAMPKTVSDVSSAAAGLALAAMALMVIPGCARVKITSSNSKGAAHGLRPMK